MAAASKRDAHAIAKLNDLARTAMGVCSKVVVTPGIRALPDAVQSRIRERVELFDQFSEKNDPYGERDFGSFDQAGAGKVNWKIDYYDKGLEYGSDDPANPGVTTRVLTIMLAEEY
jgi:hypothetical protein